MPIATAVASALCTCAAAAFAQAVVTLAVRPQAATIIVTPDPVQISIDEEAWFY